MRFIERMLVVLALVAVGQLAGIQFAHADGGCLFVPGTPGGNQAHCIGIQTNTLSKVPHGSVHVNNPSCGDMNGAYKSVGGQKENIAKGSESLGAAVGSLGGPVGTGVGAVAGTAVGAVLANLYNSSTPGVSSCVVLCVTIPNNAQDVVPYGWFTNIPWRNAEASVCLPGTDCIAGWAHLDLMGDQRTDAGRLMCGRASNWSDTDNRSAGFGVRYNDPK